MRRVAIIFLQVFTVMMALGVLSFLIWEPQVEGRNIGKTWVEIYFQDPFLVFVYLGSLPFFTGAYHALRLLSLVGAGKAFDLTAVGAVRRIKHMALLTMALAFMGQVIIFFTTSDDRAGGMAMGMIIHVVSALLIAATTVLESILHQGILKINEQE